ncbi:MAG: hypothetical protein ABR604_03825 [Jatrophihabitantaceae bacterium]
MAEFFAGHRPARDHRPASPPPAARAAPAAPVAAAIPARPPADSSLDLDAPAPSRAAPTATGPVSPSPPSTSLDLDAGAAPRPVTAAAPDTSRVRPYPVVRVPAGGRSILARKSPTLTLTRTQSGIGTLMFEAACSDEVGDVRLGCAYQLRSGQSSTVQSTGNRLAPPRSRRPLLVGGHER